MKLVTRDVDPDSLLDLLEQVSRACLSYASDHGPQVLPVGLLWYENRYLVNISEETEHQLFPGQEVVLLIDEGIYYFDLRAIYIRGQVKNSEAPPHAPTDRKWFEVIPIKTVAWDYGTLREVKDDR
ncbi:MAG: hypothetical protein PHQ40_13870 [Anaerolineaceae bacterium]|nr:hypothetical protein [Anaerolineaceae bacterium]